MRLYKTLPDLTRRRQLAVWHKALRARWSPEDVSWRAPLGNGRVDRDRVATVLSPLLMGEQAGLYSITTVIQVLGRTSEVEGQFFLTTMAVDEAKHTELLTRYYRRLEREPLSIRRLPSGYLFQSQIMSNDPIEWLTGSLVSEVLAKNALEALRPVVEDPVFGEVCDRILEDETRHLGFNHIFLADRFQEARRAGRSDVDVTAERLASRLQTVLDLVPPILRDLDAEIRGLGIDPEAFLAGLRLECEARLGKCFRAADDGAAAGAVGAVGIARAAGQ
jgi:hypothetical protein